VIPIEKNTEITREALKMLIELIDAGKDSEEIRAILQEKLIKCAKKMRDWQKHELKPGKKPPSFLERLLDLFFPQPLSESAEETVMRLIIRTFDIVACALNIMEKKDDSQVRD